MWTLIFAFLAATFVIAEPDNTGGHCKPDPVICHGPKGHRGHRGLIGDRGALGDVGPDGTNGLNATDSNGLNMIYLWSKTQTFELENLAFQGYTMTTGFSVNVAGTEIEVQGSGLYMIYYYIRDTEASLDTMLDGQSVFYLDISQYDNNQIWYQYPVMVNAGQKLTFYTYINTPFTVEASESVFYSVSIQLLLPSA